MIEFIDVNKKFGERNLFIDLNLDIKDGEFLVVSGPSGCGKTTFLNLVGGIEKPDDGKILINGLDISKRRNLYKVLKNNLGFVFQNFALVEYKTVLENLKLIASDARSGLALDECLDMVGMKGREKEKIYTLSGGEQQRVALARVLYKKCDIILADEPTGSLDRKNADEVMSILNRINESGKTVILVTHMDEYKTMGSRILRLSGDESTVVGP